MKILIENLSGKNRLFWFEISKEKDWKYSVGYKYYKKTVSLLASNGLILKV